MTISNEKKKKLKKLRDTFIKDNKLPENTKLDFMDENEEIGKIERLPTGLIALDVLTNGGLVKGKINKIGGGESTGKTTMILNFIANWQKNYEDFLTAYIPAEKSFDAEWAIKNGCDPSSTLIYEPSLAEENLDFVNKCADSEYGVDCLVIDTLQALASAKEVYKGKKNDGTHSDKEQSTSADTMAVLPRLYSQFLRMYTSKSTDNLTLLLISQVRTDITSMSYIKDKETGGNAIKHYNVLSVTLRRISDTNFPIKDGTSIPPNSFVTKMIIDKSKVADRYKGLSLNLYFHMGKFEHKLNVLATAKDIGMIDGKCVKYKDKDGNDIEIKGKGFKDLYNKITNEAIDYLADNMIEYYTKKVMSYEYNENIEKVEEEAL